MTPLACRRALTAAGSYPCPRARNGRAWIPRKNGPRLPGFSSRSGPGGGPGAAVLMAARHPTGATQQASRRPEREPSKAPAARALLLAARLSSDGLLRAPGTLPCPTLFCGFARAPLLLGRARGLASSRFPSARLARPGPAGRAPGWSRSPFCLGFVPGPLLAKLRTGRATPQLIVGKSHSVVEVVLHDVPRECEERPVENSRAA